MKISRITTVMAKVLVIVMLGSAWLVWDGRDAKMFTVFSTADVMSVCVRESFDTPYRVGSFGACLADLTYIARQRQKLAEVLLMRHELRVLKRYKYEFDERARRKTQTGCKICEPI